MSILEWATIDHQSAENVQAIIYEDYKPETTLGNLQIFFETSLLEQRSRSIFEEFMEWKLAFNHIDSHGL